MTNDAADEDEEDFEECSLTEESDHLRRALHALDVSLKPLMATCDQDTVAARLEAPADAGLCGGSPGRCPTWTRNTPPARGD